MKPIVIIAIAFVLLIPVSVFAQSSSQDDNCPIGTKAVVNGMNIDCVVISDVKKTCPLGTYQGLDNQGNFACRDIETNNIVNPQTGLMTDSQTGELILDTEQEMYGWAVIIIVIMVVAVVAAIFKKPKSSSGSIDYRNVPRRGWTKDEQAQVRQRQGGMCAHCHNPPPRWEYHHKDGNRGNNSMSNCEGVCPNCHAEETYG